MQLPDNLEYLNRYHFTDKKQNYLMWSNVKKVDPAFFTKERFSLKKLLLLKHILEFLEQDLIQLGDCGIRLKRVKKRLNLIYKVLLVGQTKLWVEDEYLIREICYGFLNKNKTGWIYPEVSSILHFPNDLRYHLLWEDYIEFNIENCYPKILYDFVQKQTKVLTPLLASLATTPQDFREEVASQLQIYNYDDVERCICRTFLSGVGSYGKQSSNLWSLRKELDTVHWQLEYYMTRQAKYKSIINKIPFNQLESYYFMTVESETLLNLKSFLEEEMKIEGKTLDLDFIPLYNGGVLIRHEYHTKDETEYFVKTEHRLLEDPIVTKSLYELHQDMQLKLHNMSVIEFNGLLKDLKIQPFQLPEALVAEIQWEAATRQEKAEKLWKNLRKRGTTQEEAALLKKNLEEMLPRGYFTQEHCDQIRKLSREFNWKVTKALVENQRLIQSQKKTPLNGK